MTINRDRLVHSIYVSVCLLPLGLVIMELTFRTPENIQKSEKNFNEITPPESGVVKINIRKSTKEHFV